MLKESASHHDMDSKEEHYKRLQHKGMMKVHQTLFESVSELKTRTEALCAMLKSQGEASAGAQGTNEGEAAEGNIPAEQDGLGRLQKETREQGWQELFRECHAVMGKPTN